MLAAQESAVFLDVFCCSSLFLARAIERIPLSALLLVAVIAEHSSNPQGELFLISVLWQQQQRV